MLVFFFIFSLFFLTNFAIPEPTNEELKSKFSLFSECISKIF